MAERPGQRQRVTAQSECPGLIAAMPAQVTPPRSHHHPHVEAGAGDVLGVLCRIVQSIGDRELALGQLQIARTVRCSSQLRVTRQLEWYLQMLASQLEQLLAQQASGLQL